jgi:oxygen-independent coproporphyrinogen III oxidase
MAGLYLHFPFCRRACHYCNFHFSTSLKLMPQLVDAMVRELEMEREYLNGAPIETIYFGGGTPSLIDQASLDKIFEAVYKHYSVVSDPEVTLEANPDDLSREKIDQLRQSPVNRLSIGIQTFQDVTLRWMNRMHTAQEAINSVEWALDAGFTALSLDLIYGIPTHTHAMWESDLLRILAWRPEHISCYALTVEEKTALHHQVQKGSSPVAPDALVAEHFELLMALTHEHGYLHYEISNFALPGKEARHNSSYWFGKPYLGIGPSAHSYRKGERRWNIANNPLYIKALCDGAPSRTSEVLSPIQEYNEHVMTRLRTSYGVDSRHVSSTWPDALSQFIYGKEKHLKNGNLQELQSGVFVLTNAGKLLSDTVILDFFC